MRLRSSATMIYGELLVSLPQCNPSEVMALATRHVYAIVDDLVKLS